MSRRHARRGCRAAPRAKSIMRSYFVGVAHLAPARVVAVLLAPLGVAAGRLEVAVGVRADPDVRPGRRDREGADARQRRLVAHRLPVRHPVGEARAGTPARDARPLVGDVAQPRLGRRLLGIDDAGRGGGGIGRRGGLVEGHGRRSFERLNCAGPRTPDGAFGSGREPIRGRAASPPRSPQSPRAPPASARNHPDVAEAPTPPPASLPLGSNPKENEEDDDHHDDPRPVRRRTAARRRRGARLRPRRPRPTTPAAPANRPAATAPNSTAAAPTAAGTTTAPASRPAVTMPTTPNSAAPSPRSPTARTRRAPGKPGDARQRRQRHDRALRPGAGRRQQLDADELTASTAW